MRRPASHWGGPSAALAVLAAAVAVAAGPSPPPALRAVLLEPSAATPAVLTNRREAGFNAVALRLSDGAPAAAAAARAKAAGLALYYWVEVGRCPELATAHPEWMAGLQGHPEWRRLFPKAPTPGPTEALKVYPWVPIAYREAFAAQLERVSALLAGLPPAQGVFLDHLQAAPSACGCGNSFCRWTPDYGPVRTATHLGADAAADFVTAVRKRAGGAEVIPVWTTECEEHESAPGGACHGVPCFGGRCWSAWTEQLMPLSRAVARLGVPAYYRALGRDQPRYGPAAGWVREAVAAFARMPPLRKGAGVPAERLITVLQGWDTSPAEQAAQIARTREAAAHGYVMAETALSQTWEPRVIRRPR
jgi:hypothetical protein